MKLLLDQNISHRICQNIRACFEEVTSIKAQGLTDANDFVIWQFAQNQGYTIVTFDEDMFNISQLRGYPPKIIWLRIGNATNDTIAQLLIQHAERINYFVENEAIGCLEIYKFSKQITLNQ